MSAAASPTPQPLSDEELRSYFDRGHQGDYDRIQIAFLLSLSPLQRLRKLQAFVDFLNRCTPEHAKLLRKRHRAEGSGGWNSRSLRDVD
jgi:hypothetical protein